MTTTRWTEIACDRCHDTSRLATTFMNDRPDGWHNVHIDTGDQDGEGGDSWDLCPTCVEEVRQFIDDWDPTDYDTPNDKLVAAGRTLTNFHIDPDAPEQLSVTHRFPEDFDTTAEQMQAMSADWEATLGGGFEVRWYDDRVEVYSKKNVDHYAVIAPPPWGDVGATQSVAVPPGTIYRVDYPKIVDPS